MMLSVPEVGIDGLAEVVSIEPCPAIPDGQGRIVISTFTHVAPETICMYLEGLAEPIRCTPNHITWSVEHRGFIEAHELQAGNLVLCDDGVREIERVEKVAEPIRVYNIEVQGQHVYQVSALGMLVHNTCPRTIDIRNLSPHPSAQRTVADAEKLARMGAFDWAKYQPIIVENMGGRMVIMDGMTRVEAALRAGITHLPAFVY
jgi:hypothetical protein